METLSWEEQAADNAKRPRISIASSSSDLVGPRPPPWPPPGRERTRSPEESAEFDDRAILDRIRFIQRKNLWRELDNVKTRKEADVLAKKISALEAELYKDDVVFEGYALAKEFAKAGEPTPAWTTANAPRRLEHRSRRPRRVPIRSEQYAHLRGNQCSLLHPRGHRPQRRRPKPKAARERR